VTVVDRGLGRLLPVDSDGFLLNDTSPDLIPRWLRPLVDYCVIQVRHGLAGDLRSLCLLGSVPRGLSRGAVSGLHFLVVLRDGSMAGETATARLAMRLTGAQDLVWRIDLEPIRQCEYATVPDLWLYQPVIKLQALLLWGEDLAAGIAPIRPTRALAASLRCLDARTDEARRRLDGGGAADFWISWLMRTYVRAGLEAIIEEVHGYSRDLPVCARLLGERYPALEDAAWQAVELAVVPAGRCDEMWTVVGQLRPFLVERRRALGLSSVHDTRMLWRRAG
jgi:hypothetical protein